jgi:uncharacterized protein (TIGR02300 family)
VMKPEWGEKRICPSCGVKFYDLRRTPITCPKCASEYPPDAPPKPRRAVVAEPPVVERPPVAKEAKGEEAPVTADAPDDDDENESDDEDFDDEKSEKDSGIIEDASELGEDEDDMAEVFNGISDEED